MYMMIGDEIDIDINLINLSSFSGEGRDLLYFEKNGSPKRTIGNCKVFPYSSVRDIVAVIKDYNTISLVHNNAIKINEEYFRGFEEDKIYINSDATLAPILAGNQNTDNINFVQFHGKFFRNIDFLITRFEEEIDDYLFLENKFKDFLVYLLIIDPEMAYGTVSLLNSKSYLNLKKNDKIETIQCFIFLGEYVPWEQIDKSNYEEDHGSKVNLLFFYNWYQQLEENKDLVSNYPKLKQVAHDNNELISNYMLRMHYEKSELQTIVDKKQNYINNIVSDETYKQLGNQKVNRQGWDNKLVKIFNVGSKIAMAVTLRAKKDSRIRLMYNEVIYRPTTKIKLFPKNDQVYYFLVFMISEKDLINFSGLQSTFNLLVDSKPLFLYDRKFTAVENLNNIRNIIYKQDEIFYFRNGYDGRVVVQKTKREYFNTARNLKYSKKQYNKSKNLKYIILYEKNGEHFEESAFRLFEKIYNRPNVYFVLRSDAPKYQEAKAKYGDKIIEPNEKRFYHIIVNAKYFIGTESPVHIIGIRSYNRYIRMKVMDRSAKFIFLQHGITYSLSLRGSMRSLFKRDSNLNIHKIVVSSQLEADHWKTYGGFTDSHIYNTGLVTFDNKKKNADAKKIVLFLTWRPWEEGLIDDVEQTSYYQDIIEIIAGLPEGPIKENFKVILHPKFKDMQLNPEIERYVARGSIDETLNEADTLITDYSSVCYDAFYRGSNVVFWWNRNEENMQNYRNKIMLSENNIFGPYCYNNEDLYKCIDQVYMKEQDPKYVAKYKKINEFDDDKNLDRLIKLLEKDEVI